MSRTDAVLIGSCPLGPAPVKVLASLMAAGAGDIPALARRILQAPPDLIEWRTDHLADRSEAALTAAAGVLRSHSDLPVLGTLRTAAEGGRAAVSEREYAGTVGAMIASGGLDAVDIELRRGASRELSAEARRRGMPVVMSLHDFSGTPAAADLLKAMERMAGLDADILKVAVMPSRREDVLVLMDAALRAGGAFGRPVIAISMGALGALTRVGCAAFGSCATFASAAGASAPGQFSVSETRRMLARLDGSVSL